MAPEARAAAYSALARGTHDAAVRGATGRVTVAGQPIRTTTPYAGAAGSQVTLALRPEVVTIVHDDDAPSIRSANRLHATVEDVMFLGAVVRTRVKVSDTTTLNGDTFNDPHATPPPLGSAITIGFPAEGCLVLVEHPA